MPFDPDIPQKITGYVIVEPGGDRPYFSHSAPLEYLRSKPDARIFAFALWLPDAPNRAESSGVVEIDLTRASIFAAIAAKHAKTFSEAGRPNGTGGDAARSAAELLRSICIRAEGAWSFAESLAKTVASAFAEVEDEKILPELVQVGVTVVQWMETIRRRQRERRAL